MARDENIFDPTKPPPEMKLYDDKMSHGDRIKATLDSTKSVGTDGKFLGMPVGPAMAGSLRVMWDQFLPYVADYAGDHSYKAAQATLKPFIKDSAKLMKYSKPLAAAMGYGAVGIQPLTELAVNAANTSSRLKEQSDALAAVQKASGHKSISTGLFTNSHNEMIDNALKKTLLNSKNEFFATLARSVSIIPALFALHNKQKNKLGKEFAEAEFEYIAEHGTEQEINEYFEKQATKMAKTVDRSESILHEQLEKQEKAYKDKFNEFRRDNSNSRKASLKADELVEGKDKADIDKVLKKYDINTEWPRDTAYQANDKDRQRIIDSRDKLKTKLENAILKENFVKKNGAWDESWVKPEERPSEIRRNQRNKRNGRDHNYDYDDYDMDSKLVTRKGMIKEQHRALMERIHGPKDKKGKGTDTEKTMSHVTHLLASLGGETLRSFVTQDTNKELKKQLALDMVFNMVRALDEKSNRSTIPGNKEGNKTEEYSFAQYVHRIFQQQQVDSGLSKVSEHYYENLKKVRWDDKEIQKLNDADLSEYEFAIKHISQKIRDGLDPRALINLVGERNIVQRSGKAFGKAKSDDVEEVKTAIKEEINHQASLLKFHHKMDEAEISESMSDYLFTQEEMHALMANASLDDEIKSFIFLLVDSNVSDNKVLKEFTGLSEDKMTDYRKIAHEHFNTEKDAVIREIASELEENADVARERYHLSEDQAKFMKKITKNAADHEGNIGDSLETEEKKKASSLVANIMMEDALHNEGKLWTERVKPRALHHEAEQKEEAALKQEEKQQLRDEAMSQQDKSFQERLEEETVASNDNYLNSPYVSKDMDEQRDKSHSKRHQRKGNAADSSQDWSVAP